MAGSTGCVYHLLTHFCVSLACLRYERNYHSTNTYLVFHQQRTPDAERWCGTSICIAMLFEKIHFEDSETVITTVRKHWFIIAVELFGVALLGTVPFLVWGAISFIPELHTSIPAALLSTAFMVFVTSLWLLCTCIIAMITWTHYYLDVWIVTDRRIIVVEQITLWHRTVGNFRLERLQDIQVSVRGIIPTLLNFGTVHAQTASAAESNFTTAGLPDPRGLQARIQQAMDARLATLRSYTVPEEATSN